MSSARDPWAFQRWAYQTTTGNPIRKSLLMVLSVMAEKSTGRCEALQATIAQWVETDDRTIRGHLKDLERLGLVARRHQYRGNGRRGCDEFLLLAPWVEEWPDGAALPDAAPGSTTGTRAPSLPEADVVTTGTQGPVVNENGPLKNDRLKTTQPPPLPAEREGATTGPVSASPGRREDGTNPRARGTSPRQVAAAPRQQGSSLRQLAVAADIWDRVRADVAPQIPDRYADYTLGHLSPVEHADDTITLDGPSQPLVFAERHRELVAASAARLGVVIQLRPPPPAMAGGRRRRRARQRADRAA